MTDRQTLDPDALARLEEWGGTELVAQMVGLFLKNAGGRMDQIRAGLTNGDIGEAERGAHSLKSSAANLGAEQLRALSGRMETVAAAGDRDEAERIAPELESAFSEVVAALESIERGMAK